MFKLFIISSLLNSVFPLPESSLISFEIIDYDAHIIIENTTSQDICVKYSSFLEQNFSFKTEDGWYEGENILQGRVSSGCQIIESGKVYTFKVELKNTFPKVKKFYGSKLCYKMEWKFLYEIDKTKADEVYSRLETGCTLMPSPSE